MAAEVLQDKKLIARKPDRDFLRTTAAAKILLITKNDVEAAQIATTLSGECRHIVEIVELDAWQYHDLFSRVPDLLLIGCESEEHPAAEICTTYRSKGGMSPILVILDGVSTDSRIKILDAGADDYLLQPLNIKELAARVETLLRRPPVLYKSFLVAGHITLDTLTGTVRKDGEELHLRPMEYNLLEFLMQNPNQVFSSQFLWQRIWKSASRSYSETVRTHIKTLRIKLDREGQPSIISTVRARGYRLECPDTNKWEIP